MIDGVHFADHLCVVALGIGIDETKHPLAVVEGSTENTTLVRGLLVGLRDRGLDVTRPILAVLDGAKALSAAVQEVFDHPVIGRCQLHKIRNVQDHLPEKLRGLVGRRMRPRLPRRLRVGRPKPCWRRWPPSSTRPTPAPRPASGKGMAETLTVLRLGVPPTLARTLRSHQRGRVDDRHLP